MTSSTIWAEASKAFEVWIETPDAARAAWLAELAASRPDVHACVVRLIRADVEAERAAFMHPRSHAVQAAPTPGLEGRNLGPWLVERLIGSGGMGQVWLARRTDGLYDGLAAIKLLRLAAVGVAANERFAREGRLLGRLSHPNIARLLDAGVTDSGERYLVLEYVEGERIDAWCDQRRVGVGERVRLFLDVCKAVAHAHENLVVHRDLKPSNIFVTKAGVVKLLDFGVAKLLADDVTATESTELTKEAGAALTPDYAAPEQLAGGAVSTATDVYGLGMVLYRLLSGARPYVAPRPSAASPDASDAAAPLWSLPSDVHAARAIAEQRGTNVAALKKTLQGDLAVVAAKAIKLDARERYGTVPEFADDLQRTLEHRPISARPDSVAYQLRRYARRHAFGLAATALVVLAVLGGIAGTLVKEREAEAQAARAVAVKRFLLDLFEQANSSVRANGIKTREATLNDILLAGADRVDRSFAGQPEIRDEIFETLLSLYAMTGDQVHMTTLARQRLAAARASFGNDDPRTVPAEVMEAAMDLTFGDGPSAKALLDHAQGVLDRARDVDSIQRARLLRWQGVYAQFHERGRPWPDHPMRRAVQLYRERYPEDDDLLEALMGVPGIACRAGYPAEALAAVDELYRRALVRYGPDNMFTAEALGARGNFLALSGDAAGAIAPLKEAIAAFRKFGDESSIDTIFLTLMLAEATHDAGDPAESTRLFSDAQARVRRAHPDDARLQGRLAAYQAHVRDFDAGKRRKCGG